MPVGSGYEAIVAWRATAGSGAWTIFGTSPGSFAVTGTGMTINVSAPAGSTSYPVGGSLTVSWTTSSAASSGQFGVWARSPAGGWYIGQLVSASGGASYSTALALDVPVGSGYEAVVAWRAAAGSGAWTLFGTSPGSFAVTGSSSLLLTMKSVPAGTFQRDATPTNTSYLAAFSMSEKEITAAQFTAVTGLANPSYFTSVVNGPVEQANWYHALVFCNKLSLREGRTPVYTIGGSTDPAAWIAANGGTVPITRNATWDAATANWSANGYRLPTEMEWEWAAMGATGGTTGYLKDFAGSTGTNAIGDYAWYWDNAGSTTRRVGTRLPNELGLYDMSGNVTEWCWDWYVDSYPTGPQTDYRGAASGTSRVMRGGGWYNAAAGCTVAGRDNNNPSHRYSGYGFRVVRP